jgi:energy-coupling factor transport system ATP-binding protein
VLSLRDVAYRYPGASRASLQVPELDLQPGSLTVVLGAAGSGLSTLCLVLSGLAPRVVGGELQGRLRLDGEDVSEWPMHRLCEDVALGLSHAGGQLALVAETVYEEVAFGPANLGLSRGEVMERTDQALEALALEGLASRDPRRLSGGEQRLVGLAGLLAMRPRCLILDDVLASLDANGRRRLRSALESARAGGAAVVLASHRTDPSIPGDTRVLVMAEGEMALQGPALELLADPATWALGIEEPAEQRMARLLVDAGDERTAGQGPDIELQAIHFAYPGGPPVLDGIDLRIPAGQSVALVGANGSGKTTLARHLDGLLRPTSGRILLAGQDIAGERVAQLARMVALGFQDPDRQVFARSARDEIAFGPRQLGFPRDRALAAVSAALEACGLQGSIDAHPQDLGESGRKLLAIASLLAMETAVLVLDEPTVGLDAAGVARVREIVEQRRSAGRTVVAISHDLGFVAETFERVVLLADGCIRLDGSPREVFAEAHWPELRAAGLEPLPSALLGVVPGPGSTPTEPPSPAVRRPGTRTPPARNCAAT